MNQPVSEPVSTPPVPPATPTAPAAPATPPTLEAAISPAPASESTPVAAETPTATESMAPLSEEPAEEPEGSDEAEAIDEADEVFEDDPLAKETISWQASEYVHHHKGAGWYAVLGLIVFILLAIAVIFKLWLSIGVFIAMGAAIAVYAYKPPRVLSYQLDPHGVTIEGKNYPFETFRSFGVLSDASWHTIDLEPAKRFMPRLNILFGDEDFDNIVAHLEAHLPRADRQPDMVERVTRYLRF